MIIWFPVVSKLPSQASAFTEIYFHNIYARTITSKLTSSEY